MVVLSTAEYFGRKANLLNEYLFSVFRKNDILISCEDYKILSQPFSIKGKIKHSLLGEKK